MKVLNIALFFDRHNNGSNLTNSGQTAIYIGHFWLSAVSLSVFFVTVSIKYIVYSIALLVSIAVILKSYKVISRLREVDNGPFAQEEWKVFRSMKVSLSSYLTYIMQMPASEVVLFKKTRANIFDDFTGVVIQIFYKINMVINYYKHWITVLIKLLERNKQWAFERLALKG